jgi:hypothetical protein
MMVKLGKAIDAFQIRWDSYNEQVNALTAELEPVA